MTVSDNYPTKSVFAFRKPSVGRSVENNLFRFHPYRYVPPRIHRRKFQTFAKDDKSHFSLATLNFYLCII
jgi:hypothetical protein